jgi:hypothetical protein
MRHRAVVSLLGGGLIALACAGAPRREAQAPPRMKDSAPEKIAAQRAAANNLHLEDEDERWGFDAARERRQQETQKKQAAPAARPAAAPGPVDLQQSATPPGAAPANPAPQPSPKDSR